LHEEVVGYQGEEYKYIGLFLGNVFSVIRAALGDFAVINASMYLEPRDNQIFWLLFFIILILTNIIFLNFVIAEAGNSYQ
jgi:hypothetical protein